MLLPVKKNFTGLTSFTNGDLTASSLAVLIVTLSSTSSMNPFQYPAGISGVNTILTIVLELILITLSLVETYDFIPSRAAR